MLQHRYMISAYAILEGPPSDLKSVLVIQTNIELDCLHKDFDQAKRDELEAEVIKFLDGHRSAYHSVRLLPRGLPHA